MKKYFLNLILKTHKCRFEMPAGLNKDVEILYDKLYYIVQNSTYDSISIDEFNRMEQEYIRIHDESRRLWRLPHTVEMGTGKCLYGIRKYLLKIHRSKGLLFEFERPPFGGGNS